MFDFRYHVVTIIAIFLALAVGTLFGVTVADRVVSGAKKSLEDSLQEDLSDARADRAEALKELRLRESFEDQVYPSVVDGVLIGRRIGVLAFGQLPEAINRRIRSALQPSGGQIKAVASVETPIDIENIGKKFSDHKEFDLAAKSQSKLAEKIGRKLVASGSLRVAADRALFATRSGSFGGLDGIVYFRSKRGFESHEKHQTDRFEVALIRGLLKEEVPVVGVEESDAEHSQIAFYSDHDLTSVDDLDLAAGQTALVFALAGAKGQFGVKSTATQLLPQTEIADSK